jgi:signal transduction histidine kinase
VTGVQTCALPIFICKEGINNAIKYAYCKNITVEIKRSNGMLEGMISDDGKGFELSVAEAKKRNGLKNMKERSEKYKRGMFHVITCPGKGTKLLFVLPE